MRRSVDEEEGLKNVLLGINKRAGGV